MNTGLYKVHVDVTGQIRLILNFLKKSENQPRLEKFDLKSNLTCNIQVDTGLGEKP